MGTPKRRGEPLIDKLRRFTECDPNTGCWLWWAGALKSGYGVISLPPSARPRRTDLAHRVSYEVHRGPIPEGMFVCHSCDTPACCNPGHLFLGAPKDNTADMIRKGRMRHDGCPGERNGRAKLRAEDVHAVRARLATGESSRSIAKDYSVSAAMVGHIKHGNAWKEAA